MNPVGVRVSLTPDLKNTWRMWRKSIGRGEEVEELPEHVSWGGNSRVAVVVFYGLVNQPPGPRTPPQFDKGSIRPY